MSGLVEFLRARLDEDEATALEAPKGPWHIGNAIDPTEPCDLRTFPDVRMVADGLNWLVAEHIARHNPARILVEVEAKRRIVDDAWGGPDHQDMWEHHIRLLALPYASHPDYREEWKP
ncbi:DUF6221 family protein [Streptomyces canus]|uniref:DUF6221 family protein n=1 Tax=Streptomyces canus TaxID=58343 RepID=UPI0027801929|nr:DUF6221 family protein [Streptomyces canus]MDQ0758682.1 hypothetical protein [Streptomyces canus]